MHVTVNKLIPADNVLVVVAGEEPPSTILLLVVKNAEDEVPANKDASVSAARVNPYVPDSVTLIEYVTD